MTPLPPPLEHAAALVAWRLDAAEYAAGWDSGIGAQRQGGRWNPRGMKAVYCSFDPATCILEAAVHRGFEVLDTRAHTLTSFAVANAAAIHVVRPQDIPNPAWLHGGIPSAGQQHFGAELLGRHGFVAFPSAVSKLSWNLVFMAGVAAARYSLRSQERLVLDTRLNPAPASAPKVSPRK